MTNTDLNSQRIRELYGKYANATATEEELNEFLGLAADPENEGFFENLMSGSWDELYQKGNELRLLKQVPLRRIQFRRLLRWAAAASVIGFLAYGSFLLFNRKTTSSEPSSITSKPKDVSPAGNRATLILSTGQQIILDSANKGQLARFGNTTITKTDSGKLLYASTGTISSRDENNFNTLSTPRGGVYQLTLPDGTKAWLNAASRIDYPTRFTGKIREVFISGEIYFEVAHDATHPFLVSLTAKTRNQGESGHWMQIEVLGTHFNVNAYDDNENSNPGTAPEFDPTRTTLLEGSIKISAQGLNKMIKPGEQAAVRFGNRGIEITKNVDVDKVMAWRNGKMTLTDGTVRQVMTEISRWYDMDIEYKGVIPNKQFFGSIRRDVPLSTVLNALSLYGVKTTIEGKKIIVQ